MNFQIITRIRYYVTGSVDTSTSTSTSTTTVLFTIIFITSYYSYKFVESEFEIGSKCAVQYIYMYSYV